MGIVDALKLGWRSIGDDAARVALGHDVAGAIKTASINDAVSRGVSGQDLAQLYPQIQSNAEDFLTNFHAAYKPPTFDSVPQNLAYGATRKVAGGLNAINQGLEGVGGIPGAALQAAFVAPMFMQGGGQQQAQQNSYTNDDVDMMRRQQAMQQQQQQQQTQYYG